MVETVEAKHIFIDIINYTQNRSVEAQSDLISYLNTIVLKVIDSKQIGAFDRLFMPTGDGMCISLLNITNPYDVHIQIALDILEKIHEHNQMQKDNMRQFNIRIGINENIDNLVTDINGQRNISGSGINYAARIEGLCDKNQILVGNSVYEKLVQREKYMNSFISYDTTVKHGVALQVHQYVNANLDYLNNTTPQKLLPFDETHKLNEIQAYYIGCCLRHEEFITSNSLHNDGPPLALHVLMMQLANDLLDQSRVTKTYPNARKRVKKDIQEHLNDIRKIDFWIICDLNNYIHASLADVSECFSERFLFISAEGKRRLFTDQPEICKELGIEAI